MQLKNITKDVLKVRVGEQLYEWQPGEELTITSQDAISILNSLTGQLLDPTYTLDEQLSDKELVWIRNLAWGIMILLQTFASSTVNVSDAALASKVASWFQTMVTTLEVKMQK